MNKSRTEKQSVSINGNGGKRPGAGRKPGVPNKRTALIQKAVESTGVTPLEYMLSVMRDTTIPDGAEPAQVIALTSIKFEAAKAAAPYVHAKLSSVELNANVSTHEASLDHLA